MAPSDSNNTSDTNSSLELDIPEREHLVMMKKVLQVDRELNPKEIRREILFQENRL